MRVALIQVASPDTESPESRRHRVGEMVRSSGNDTDLVVLPELWAAGYFSFDHYKDRAESLNGPTVSAAQEWARTLGKHIHAGSFLEKQNTGHLHNTAILVDPSGEVVHLYRKIHVFGYQSKEAQLLAPGNSISVTNAGPLGNVAATTCYDLRFPELWRALVDSGAHTVIVPAAWPAARRSHWQLFTSTRALEEQCVVVACNAVGTQRNTELGGHSRVVDPWGAVLLEADNSEGIFTCDIPETIVTDTRNEFPVLQDRRSQIATASTNTAASSP